MTTFKSFLPVMLILAAALGSASLKAGDTAKPSDVTVVNGAGNPVPTTVQGTASVTVTNTALNPITIANKNEPAMQPFFAQSFLTMADGSCCASYDENVYTVPAGKILVVEHASGSSAVGTGQLPYFEIDAIRAAGGLAGAHQVALTRKGASCLALSCDVWDSSQPLRMYVAGGDHLRFVFGRTEGSHFANAQLYLTGYLVDAP